MVEIHPALSAGGSLSLAAPCLFMCLPYAEASEKADRNRKENMRKTTWPRTSSGPVATFAADGATEGFDAVVAVLVLVQRLHAREPLGAEVAGERPLSGVDAVVPPQIACLRSNDHPVSYSGS